jgi:uncharacterized membrane protein YjjP (DUF1212 family)
MPPFEPSPAARAGAAQAAATGPRADPATAFVLKLGRALARAGYPTHRLEDALTDVSARLELRGQFFVTPTSIFASFGPDERQHTHLIRVEPGSTDLGAIASVEEIGLRVAYGRLDPAAGIAELDAFEAAPSPYSTWLSLLAFVVSSACAARFLGGAMREIVAAGAVGMLVGVVSLAGRAWPALARVAEAATAFAAAFALAGATRLALPMSTTIAALAGLIALLPGLPLVVAMAELVARHLVSGTSRFVGAVMSLVGLVFGVALGSAAASIVFRGPPLTRTPVPPAGWTLAIALALAPAAFLVLMRGRARHLPMVFVACVAGYFGGQLGVRMFGPELGIIGGSLSAGVAANLLSRWTGVSAGVMLPPALLLLVPGSIGFRGLALMLDHQVLDGVQAAFRMVIMLSALVAGLFAATTLAPPPRRWG